MSDFSFSKLTASLEELSLAKQLPLRQQVSKPILKYDTSVTKPVQLFKHADLSNFRQDGHSHGYGSIAQASSTTSMSPVRYRPTPPAAHGLLTTKPGQTYMMTGSQEKTPTNSKAHSNPYARPLSAKDIVNDLQSQKLKKSSSTSQMASHSTGSINVNSIISSGVPFQMNSFMRPQSAVRKDSKPKVPTSPSKTDSKTSCMSQASATEIASVTSVNDKGNNLAMANEADLENNEDVDENSKPDEPKSPRMDNSSKIQSKIASGYHITRTTNFKSIDKSSPQKTAVPNKVISSIPRPGASAIVTKTVASPEPPRKIRNLNYTPTKPYTDVDRSGGNSPQKSVTSKPPLSPHKPVQTTSTNTSNAGCNSKSEKDRPNGCLKTATTAAGTRKGSKVEEKVHEQRPPVIGAPAKVARISEKPSVIHIINENEEYSDTENPGERFPGDGEASDDDFDDEDALEGLEDDYFGSDGESDGISITSSLSRKSSSARIRSSRSGSRAISFSSSDENVAYHRPATVSSLVRPAFNKSLFVHIPPTLNFAAEGEKIEQLSWEMRKFLKWRMSPITPNVVKAVLAKVGFRITKRNHDWMGCWGKHMKSPGFKAIREYQKLNHFPGSFQIGRKDRLWRNLLKMQVHFGKKEFGFFPQTFVLPADSKQLKRAWEDGGNKQKWIIKPPASARGIGIKVIHKWNQIPRKRPVIVQRYIARPYLINDSKFDLRIYVYVSSFDPLRIYVFEDGLARFASCKYSSAMKNLTNKFMHLTNYSVNKKNSEYQNNTDEQVCQGHKWGLKAFWSYLKRQGVNTFAIWDNIKDLVIKTIVCSDNPVNSLIKANVKSRYCVHELFGFDILLDDSLKPWILEVNISPSLHSNSQLDINIKSPMIRDLFNIAGFRIPDKNDVSHASSGSGDFSNCVPSADHCMDKRLFSQQLSPDEKSKHAYYCQKHQDEQVLQTILDILTPSDIRMLTESIDEDNRKGGFQRIFPTPSTHKYLRFFETPRYCNLLIDQYIQRYNRMEQRGIAMLDSYCKEKIHVQFNTDNSEHQWTAPNMSLSSYRESRMPSAPAVHHKEIEQGIKHSASASQFPNMPKKSKMQQLKSLSQTNSTNPVSDSAEKNGTSLMITARTTNSR